MSDVQFYVELILYVARLSTVCTDTLLFGCAFLGKVNPWEWEWVEMGM